LAFLRLLRLHRRRRNELPKKVGVNWRTGGRHQSLPQGEKGETQKEALQMLGMTRRTTPILITAQTSFCVGRVVTSECCASKRRHFPSLPGKSSASSSPRRSKLAWRERWRRGICIRASPELPREGEMQDIALPPANIGSLELTRLLRRRKAGGERRGGEQK